MSDKHHGDGDFWMAMGLWLLFAAAAEDDKARRLEEGEYDEDDEDER